MLICEAGKYGNKKRKHKKGKSMTSLYSRCPITTHYTVKEKIGIARGIVANTVKKIQTNQNESERIDAYITLFDEALRDTTDRKDYYKSLVYMGCLLEGANHQELAQAYEGVMI
jgi:hypothetical protein